MFRRHIKSVRGRALFLWVYSNKEMMADFAETKKNGPSDSFHAFYQPLFFCFCFNQPITHKWQLFINYKGKSSPNTWSLRQAQPQELHSRF